MKTHLSTLALAAALVACGPGPQQASVGPRADIDLDSIVARGTLRVVTDYNMINYFVYKGVSVGYQYELVGEYAKHLGVELEISASNDNERNIEGLLSGKYDIVATSLIVDTVGKGSLMAFAEPYGRSRQVLVQRTDDGKPTLQSAAQLAGDTLSVQAKSFYLNTIAALNDTLDTPVHIEEIEYYDVEQLIQLVAEREIKQTISLDNIAKANRWYYSNIDIGTPMSGEYDLAWGLRPNAPKLKAAIDKWLSDFKKTARFRHIYQKYVIDPRDHHSSVQSTSAKTYKSDYEEIVKKAVADSPFDWILVSSVIYQESHFNPKARSWAGACGLMQLMPQTAVRFGAHDLQDPQQNITAGVKFLNWLDARLVQYVPNHRERVKFVLAAYNVGLGHVMDAMRLAQKFGKNPSVWNDNAEVALLHKANPTFYSDPVVKHGYCRGTETINYVRNVMERYANYKRLLEP